MKKTKLFTSLAAFVLVLGLGACNQPKEEETTGDESGEVSTDTDTGSGEEGGSTTDTDTTPKETNPDGYVLVGDFTDSNWDAKVSEDSKYYIPLGTTEYKQTVTIAAEPDYGENDPWSAGLRVVEWGDSWNLVVGSDELDEASTGVIGSDGSKNIKVNWGETYDITITFGDTNSILVTIQEEGGNEGEKGNEEVFSGTYKLGALDEGNYCYRYFNGGTNSSKLTTTDDWEEAVEVTIELDETALETLDDGNEELTGTPYTLSFTDADGNTKYISWSSSTNVDLSDTAYTWYWVDSIECFAAGALDGRVLVYYASSSDIRAYAQTDTNLAYPHVYPYTEAQENPKAPEVTTTYEQVSSLGEGGEFYAGGYSGTNLYLTTGAIDSTYYLAVTQDLDNAVPFTVTGDATNGYKLTNAEGKYVYAYDGGSYYDFGLSDAETVPSSGTNLFFWEDTAKTLYCNASAVNSSRYTYVYFEFYGGHIAAWGNNTTSFSNAASFYQLVTA